MPYSVALPYSAVMKNTLIEHRETAHAMWSALLTGFAHQVIFVRSTTGDQLGHTPPPVGRCLP